MSVKDKTWSWVVLAVVTFIVFLAIGIVKGFSVLLPDIKEQLATDTWIIGSCISIFTGWGYTLGLTADVFVKKFGSRFCFMLSGFVSSIGLIISACATHPYVLLVGVLLSGFLLLQENIALGIVPDYFDKQFNIAVNIYLFGGVIALMVIPVVTQALLNTYGWRGALLLLSGLTLHTIPFGALLKQREKQHVDEQEGIHLISHSIKNPPEETTEGMSPLKWLQMVVDTSLLTSIPFIARVLVPGFVNGYTFNGWVIYIISFAQSNGASGEESTIVSICGGIGLGIIRIALPYLNTLMTYKQLMYTSAVIMSTSLVLTTLLDGLVGMGLSSFIFGIGVGILATEGYIATKANSTEAKYLNALALFHLVYGFAAILGGLVTGVIYDVTGSFTISFAALSAVSMLTAVSLGLEEIRAGIINSRMSY